MKYFISLFVLMLSFISLQASAGDNSASAVERPGVYVGVNLAEVTATGIDASHLVNYNIGYDINRVVGIEISRGEGHIVRNHYAVTFVGANIGYTFDAPAVRIYGKVGRTAIDVDYNFNYYDYNFKGSLSDTQVALGGGLRASLSDDLYAQIELLSTTFYDEPVTMTSIGLGVKF